jgi:alkanesulfonate monooxygenase SsuD/methylene tetrahydromethanopterin reductase-like flavin-dependent oxidoreductase (luciferase family)
MTMKIGMTLPTMVSGFDRTGLLEWSRRIDQGPFSSLAAGERISFPNTEMMVSLSAAAAVTERVDIIPTLVVLPLHSPILMAKQLATLDVLSQGRLRVAVGAGGREEDYRAVGASYDRRLAQVEKGVELMRRTWAGESVVEGALRPVEPYPLQGAQLEVLSGSMTPTSIQRASGWADGICGFSFGPSIQETETVFQTARDAWKEAGREDSPKLVTSAWFSLEGDKRSQMDAYVRRYLEFTGEETAAALAPLATTTSATALKDVIRSLEELGTDEFILVPTTSDPDEVNRVADLIG